MRYSVPRLGTFGHVSSTFVGGVRKQWLGFFICIGSIGAGWLGDVSGTDLPCVHAIYMEDHRRQTMDSCKKLMVPVCIYTFCNRKLYNVHRNAIIICTKESSMCTKNVTVCSYMLMVIAIVLLYKQHSWSHHQVHK